MRSKGITAFKKSRNLYSEKKNIYSYYYVLHVTYYFKLKTRLISSYIGVGVCLSCIWIVLCIAFVFLLATTTFETKAACFKKVAI